jgi:hypothetical protein
MTILWIPHSPWREGTVGRDQHLIRHLRRFGHTVATVSWPLRRLNRLDVEVYELACHLFEQKQSKTGV